MIIIDGRQSDLAIANYATLDELLANVVEEEGLGQRIVTDVLLDDESFSELYPHQAEDIASSSFSRLEVRTVSFHEMAQDVIAELPKVVSIMARGSREVAALLRLSKVQDGLESLQDLLDLSRGLLDTVSVLRSQYAVSDNVNLDALGDELGSLLAEMSEVMENADWLLLADLLEFEFVPACEGWRSVIAEIDSEIRLAKAV